MFVLLAENVKKDILVNSSNSTWKLVGLILLCVIIIVACYYTTRFIGKRSQGGQGHTGGKNIKALETFRVTQNKYLQLIKCGDKYLLIGVTKDNISVLSEIDPESLLTESDTGHKSFKELISGLKGKGKPEKKSISEFADIRLDGEESPEFNNATDGEIPEDAAAVEGGEVPASEENKENGN